MHLLAFDSGKARQREDTKKQIDEFLVQAQLCHDNYNRYITPHVEVACAAAHAEAGKGLHEGTQGHVTGSDDKADQLEGRLRIGVGWLVA